MIVFHRLRSLARWVFRRSDVESELNRELDTFIEFSAAQKVRDGVELKEARRQARLELGGLDQTRERVRWNRWGAQLDRIWQDLRYGWRSLAAQPGVTVVIVLTLAVGIGGNTAIYSVVDATMIRTLPFEEPDRLMQVSLTVPSDPDTGRPGRDVTWSFPKYETFRQNQEVFQDIALYWETTLNLTGSGEPERLRAAEVTAGYFPVLGIRAEVGRTFLPEEDATPEKHLVTVLSHGLWVRRFGADRTIIGKTIALDLRSFTVVGVLPAGFQGLSGPVDLWVPVHRNSAEFLSQRWSHMWRSVARLKPDIGIDQAKNVVARLGKIVDEAHPLGDARRTAWGARAEALNDTRMDPEIRKSVLVLFGAVIFVLVIACVNVANLLLVRTGARRREIAIRAAIGAGRRRVMQQLLTESLLLAFLGGMVSLIVAYISVVTLSSLNPATNTFAFSRSLSGLTLLGFGSIRLDSNALLFTFGTALLAGLLFGLAPAWQAARTDLTDSLKKIAKRPFGSSSIGGKGVLVVVEIGMAVVLLAGAGLMIKSFSNLAATRIGVEADNVLTVRLSVPPGPSGPEGVIQFFNELEQRVAAHAGIVSAGVGNCHPLGGGCGSTIIRFRDRSAVPAGTEPGIGVMRVSAHYFKTMKIPLVGGRLFSDDDRPNTSKVVLINETAAQQYWPGEDPVGKPIGLGINGFGERAEIIGIVGDVRYVQKEQPLRPDAYVSIVQAPNPNMYLFVRTSGDPTAMLPTVRQHVHALDPNVPIYDVKTMQQRISDSLARARFNTTLLAIFAVTAMVLAAVGIYGVMSYVVRQRTREIGIRMALGARSQDVVRQIVRRAAGLVLAGTGIGLIAALIATRVLASSLYEVKPGDPQTLVIISLVLAAVALLASYVPARRASAVDPSITLRAE